KNDNTWGWTDDYVQQLAAKLPRRGIRIPLFHLAVWLYKDRAWEDEIRRADIIGQIIAEYGLTQEELNNLFQIDVVSDLTEGQAFQKLPVKWHQILAAFSQPKDVPAEASGILTYLETEAIGPVPRLVFQPAKRINLITGDNGLGKTFLLDLSWWALTQDWAERPATPFHISPSRPPLIKFAVGGPGESRPTRASYSYSTGNWEIKEPRTALSGLVVYARVDGSFAVWDPANPMLAGTAKASWRGLKFTREEIWDGKKSQIEGLISDWTKWQLRPDRYPAFSTLQAVLRRVSPPDLGPMTIGELVRIPGGDNREIPTLVHPYDSVPIFFESAGIKRIITLAYLLVWAWEEHKVQAKQQGRPEERQMVVLIDEAEAHLHPKWQRVILPALLGVAQDLHAEMAVQWIIASHSPLVLASGESIWDTQNDRLFHIDMSTDGKVFFKDLEFEKRGTIDSWLSSDIFEIQQPGSSERESAIKEALRLQQMSNPTKAGVQAATTRLREHLSAEDPFWVRWIFFAESFGVKP
ncbi:MAG: AAA family ATPase, partial [Desulfobacterales bacterium]|nr:AAA family ATPase [Desulfobacterales bacterium]